MRGNESNIEIGQDKIVSFIMDRQCSPPAWLKKSTPETLHESDGQPYLRLEAATTAGKNEMKQRPCRRSCSAREIMKIPPNDPDTVPPRSARLVVCDVSRDSSDTMVEDGSIDHRNAVDSTLRL